MRRNAMAKVVIFGATDAALLNHFYLTHDSPHEVVAFTVDRNYVKEETLCGLPVVPFEEIESTYPPSEYKMFVAIFYGRVNRTRAEKYAQTKAKGYELISYISTKAVVWPGLVVGDNCFIGENCSIGPFVKIGNDVSISPGTVVGHDGIIKDHCFLAAHVAMLGCVTIEPYCFLGANCTIRNDVVIARECIIGAGVAINKHTQERGVYVGSSAQLLPKTSDVLSKWLTWPLG
jgi:sugar O-acyltransferase (sialic acid O-acetyltransferase NeuD family)